MSNIFGRDAELASLRAAFNTSATRNKEGRYGGPQMVFIVAESGIGKSRLVQELYLQLASDKQWDPPESNYWPDAFGSIGDQILTNPNLDGHTPKGPPRFIWLGVRWTPVADRNPQLAQSILPDLLSKVNAHVNILERYGSVWSSAWSRALKKVHGDGINDVTDEIATKLIEITIQEIPFAGLVWKAAKGAKKLAEDRIEGIKSFDDIQREQAQSTAEEAVNVMRDLLHPKGAVPTILWFDDAQWIDDQTLQFLRNLWVEARKHGWPLFVVVTHWEREWRELERSASGTGSLKYYLDDPGVSVIELAPSTSDSLSTYLRTKLPGLTAMQNNLLVGKAGGNFLTMVENIYHILSKPRNFVDSNTLGPLSDKAVEIIRSYESNREKHVRQRFYEFEESVQDILGWGSQFGSRFVADVVTEFARQKIKGDSREFLARCVDPYVVLGISSDLSREFRDKVFYSVADDYRRDYLADDDAPLRAVYRKHLLNWINASFDDTGHWLDGDKGKEAKGIFSLTSDDRRNILDIAIKELAIQENPAWSSPDFVGALRTILLALRNSMNESQWLQAEERIALLESIDWNDLPPNLLSSEMLDWLLSACHSTGEYRVGEKLARMMCEKASERYLAERTTESLSDLAWSQYSAGMAYAIRCGITEPIKYFKQALKNYRELASRRDTPLVHGMISECLRRIGHLTLNANKNDQATVYFEEALAIRRELLNRQASEENMYRLANSMGDMGHLAFCRSITGELTSDGKLTYLPSELEVAREYYIEAIEASRGLVSHVGTPENLSLLAGYLNAITKVYYELDNLDEAQKCGEEALSIFRDQARILETRNAIFNLQIILDQLVEIAEKRGNLELEQKYNEEKRVVAEHPFVRNIFNELEGLSGLD